MDPETQPPLEQQLHDPGPTSASDFGEALQQAELMPPALPSWQSRVQRAFIGPDGLRAGWSVVLWLMLIILLILGIGFVFAQIGLLEQKKGLSPRNMFFNELLSVMALAGSVAVMALIERRRLLDYNLSGPRMPMHFFAGLAVGFVGLSMLVGGLAAGGWLHITGVALSGTTIVTYGAFWALLFLLVGLFEEGAFRGYLLSTLTRGINFWWALGAVSLICGLLLMRHRSNGLWGDYALATLGLLPCYILHRRRAAHSAFWQAAWVTSTLFGFVHTSNGGENWIGIFAAGAIGFVFCVSVRLTGSAWWAIGTHAGWDWGETYFYGTPDSGMVAPGHYLSTTLSGNALWSGGATGPEGSLLVLAVILLMLVWLLVVYGRRRTEKPVASAIADAAQ